MNRAVHDPADESHRPDIAMPAEGHGARGAAHDRDINAARNILDFATAGWAGSGLITPEARGAGKTPQPVRPMPDRDVARVEARTASGWT